MKKEIVIVLNGRMEDVEKLTSELEANLIGQVAAANLDGFRFEKRDLPTYGTCRSQLEVPAFMQNHAKNAKKIRAQAGKGAANNG